MTFGGCYRRLGRSSYRAEAMAGLRCGIGNSRLCFSNRVWKPTFSFHSSAKNAKCRVVEAERGSSNDPFAEFLTKEIGLSKSQVTTVRQKIPRFFGKGSMKTPGEVVQLFREYGFDDVHIRKLVVANPSLLRRSVDENLRPKLDAIRSLGISNERLRSMICRGNRILTYPGLPRNIEYLEILFRGRNALVKALNREPCLIAYSPEKLERLLAVYRKAGMQENGIFRMITKNPSVLARSLHSARSKIEYLEKLGLSPSKSRFASVFVMLLRTTEKKFDEKIKLLVNLGMSEEAAKELVRTQPSVLATSSDKILSTTEYLVSEAGIDLMQVLKDPLILTLSLNQRIIPRHAVFKYLKNRVTLAKFVPSLLSFIKLSEVNFHRLFVEANVVCRPKLLEIYSRSRRDTKTSVSSA